MRLCTKSGNYNHATNRRRRQLAAMPAACHILRRASNRVFNRIQSKSRVPALVGISIAGWSTPITRVFDPGLGTVAVLTG